MPKRYSAEPWMGNTGARCNQKNISKKPFDSQTVIPLQQFWPGVSFFLRMSTALKNGHPVPWRRRVVAGLSPWRLRFNIRVVRKGFMVGKVSVGQSLIYSPTDALVSCLKNNKIYIKTAPTCFGTVTPPPSSLSSSLMMVHLHRNLSELF